MGGEPRDAAASAAVAAARPLLPLAGGGARPGPARGLARWCVSLYFCPLCPFNVTFGAVLRRGWFVRVMLWVAQPALGVWK